MSKVKVASLVLEFENGEEEKLEIDDKLIKFIVSSLRDKGENPVQTLELLCKLGFNIPEVKRMIVSSIVPPMPENKENRKDIQTTKTEESIDDLLNDARHEDNTKYQKENPFDFIVKMTRK